MSNTKRLKIILVAAILLVVAVTIAHVRSATSIDTTQGVLTNFSEATRVVDGDTIVVEMANGTQEKVRLVGINTPETVARRRAVECYGREASQRMHGLVEGKLVRLEADPQAGERDKYGRLLRYVYLQDGTLVNEVMIRDGYAHENGYGHPYKMRERFRTLEREARDNHRGLWDPRVCPEQDHGPPTRERKRH